MPHRQAAQAHAATKQAARRLAGVAFTSAAALLIGLIAAAPPAAAAGRTTTPHRVPGLIHPRRVPQRAAGPRHLLGSSRAVPGHPASRPASGPATPETAVMRADAAAARLARRTGRPEMVASQTTQTMEVLAHPDGEFEFISNALPVRVQVRGRWTPISTTLRRDAGGSWTAPLMTAPVVFSGGGDGSLATVTDPATGRSVSVAWPYRLPRPEVSGSVALYPAVLPGVDLRLQATSTGYQEVLIVENAAAAADPRLRRLTFTLQGGPGVTIRRGLRGATTAVDSATGKVLFTSGQSLMWDSSGARSGGRGRRTGPGRIFTVPATAGTVPAGSASGRASARAGRSQLAVTLTPPAAALSGPKITFPEYIDPEISDSSTQYYSEVASFGGFWDTTTGTTSVGAPYLESGYCGYSNCVYDWDGNVYNGYVDRDYFRMDTTPLEERNGYFPDVYSATFYADELTNSDGCTAQDVDLFSAGAISSSTRWGGPEGSYISDASSNKGGGSGCAAGDVDLNATSYLQGDEGENWPNFTFELRAPSETNELQYKTFDDNPSLDVYYNFAPLAPTNLGVSDSVSCTSTTYTSASEPGMTATGKDNNPSPLNLDYDFQLDTSAGASVASANLTNGGGGYASGKPVSWDSEGSLTSGDAYKYAVVTTNVIPSGDKSSARSSPNSGQFDFTVMSTPPSSAPAISSFDYPAGQWGQATGAPGVFTVGTNGDANIAGFAYSFDGGSGSEPVPDTTDCTYLSDGGLGTSANANGGGNSSGELALEQGTSMQIQVPSNLTAGQHTLYVRSFDLAHNASPEAAYTFYVAPNYQETSQPVTYTDASSLVSTATGPDTGSLTVQSTCCNITTWRGGSQLLFSPAAAGDYFTLHISVPQAGTWQLGADMTTAAAYGDVTVDLDASTSDIALGGTATTPFVGYNPVVSNTFLDLGTQYLTAGAHSLTFTVSSQGQAAGDYQIGINYLTLSPTNRYEAGSLTWSGTNSAGTLGPQCFSEAAWSDNCQLYLSNTASGTSFTMSFTAPVESDYALGVHLTTADDYGELRFDLDPSTSDINLDDTAADPINADSASVSAEYAFLGAVHLTAGTHVLKVTVVGTTSSTGNEYNAGINYLEAVPVTGATDASFTSAMNSLGIISDGASTTGRSEGFDLTNDGYNLSLQALEDAGVTPGSATGAGNTFSLNGATFTMPELSATGGTVNYDNVIPDGQQIPLPAVKATGVALLVAATCGATPAATATLSYGGGAVSPSNATIPSVPDWQVGATSGAVMQLGYFDAGSTKETAIQPRLYEVMLPANPTAPLASITLPVMPENLLTNTSTCAESNALHILAIGTRTVAAGPSGTAWTGAYDGPMDTTAANGPNLAGETLRASVPVSSHGSGSVRIHLSNAHTNAPVTFDAATIAAQATGGGATTVAGVAPVAVTFGGSASVTIPAGGDVYSDPVAIPSTSAGSGELTVSLYTSSATAITSASIHESVESSFVTYDAAGNLTTSTNSDGTDFTSTDSLQGVYYLSGLDVSQTPAADGTLAVLGDQTSTAVPAYTAGTWVSDLPSALTTSDVTMPGSIVDASTSDAPPDGWWRLNGTGLDTSSTAYDSGTTPTSNLTLEGSPAWTTGNPGTGTTAGSLSLNGTSQYAQSAGSVITTTSSFAVSAWVKLASLPAKNATAVGQDGATDSGFYLGYDYGHSGDWAFYLPGTDTTSPAITGAYGPAAVAGQWTLLTGVYNAETGDIQLYVNGALAASTTFTPAWQPTGSFTVGRDLDNGVEGDFFPGEITDVRAYNRVMWAYNISEIYDDNGQSSLTTANAAAAFEDYAAVEPNLRDVIVSLGSNDVLEGQSAAAIESNLRILVADFQGRIINNAGGAGVQVLLTTIPPLNLASGDPREAVRKAVNTWITGNGTTATPLDIASAVASSSSPNDIAAQYLTGGVPNASYYAEIATAVATGIADTVPSISL